MYIDLTEEEVAIFKDTLAEYKKFKLERERVQNIPPAMVIKPPYTTTDTDFLYWAMVGFSIGIFFCLLTRWPKQ